MKTDADAVRAASPRLPRWDADAAVAVTTTKRRDAWLRERQLGIGGSDAAAILGLDPYRSPLEVYADKVTEVEVEDPKKIADHLALGTAFESAILDRYEVKRDATVTARGVLLQSRRHAFMRDTLDGSQVIPSRELAGVAQCKTTGRPWDYKDDRPPQHVLVQVQHEMFVTGLAWSAVVICEFPSRRVRWIDVEAHGEFQAMLVELEAEFWARVQRREPPDIDGSASSARALHRLFPEDHGEVVRLLGAEHVSRQYAALKGAIAKAEGRCKEIANWVRGSLGTAKMGVLEDGSRWTLPTVAAHTFHCEACGAVTGERAGHRPLQYRPPYKSELKNAFTVHLAGRDVDLRTPEIGCGFDEAFALLGYEPEPRNEEQEADDAEG